MRAKTINEVQEFERGQDPRSTMEIGGVLLNKVRIDLKKQADKKWSDYLDSLLGKTISGVMNKSMMVKGDGIVPGPGWGKYTIVVQRIMDKPDIDVAGDIQGFVVEYDKAAYIISLGEKIYIK